MFKTYLAVLPSVHNNISITPYNKRKSTKHPKPSFLISNENHSVNLNLAVTKETS